MARAWLSRACRLAPDYHAATLALASLWLGDDDAEAERLFSRVLEHHDVRAAWIGVAVARRDEGAAALAHAYSRHALTGQDGGLADRLAGGIGWCGIRVDGSLAVSAGSAQVRRDGEWLSVTRDGGHLLGSPIDLAAITRIEGCVSVIDGAIEGWAWHPGDPARDPVLTFRLAGLVRQVTATALCVQVDSDIPLAQPRSFSISAAELADASGAVAVLGPDGRHLTGSPLDPGAVLRVSVTPARRAAMTLRPPVDIVVPVYRGLAETLACIASALASRPRGSRVIVVDDASPEPELVAALDRLAACRKIILVRHAENQGFPAAANAGLRTCAGRDVVLLNSDTLVPPGWLSRLRRAAYSASDIGTATPLSNDATILSYPDASGDNAAPDATGTARLDALAARVNVGITIDIPTAIGFCLYLRRDCLDAVGELREDLFAQGYGEENDFSMRAKALGWRHVAAADVFVAHCGGRSFGAARRHLLARNAAVLHRLHPGYHAAIAAFVVADPLAAVRRRLDEARWHAAAPSSGPAVLLVTHAAGGGVERQVLARCAAIQASGQRAIVLRPDGSAGVRVCEGGGNLHPNLSFALPAERLALVRLLAASRPAWLELHHRLGHVESILDVAAGLSIPVEVHLHDYAAICPRMNLIGPDGRYCGEPDVTACTACIATVGRNDGRDLTAAALRADSASILASAARAIVPSADAARRLRRHFPAVRPEILPHEEDRFIPPPDPARATRCRVVVVGAIGIEKGYAVLLACARDAATRNLPIEFVVVGHTINDAGLHETGRVFVTGEYRQPEVVQLIRAQAATLGWVPSASPETWCFSLTEIWRAGLPAVAFDIGAPAERIRRRGHGMVLPAGLLPAAINDALIRASAPVAEESMARLALIDDYADPSFKQR